MRSVSLSDARRFFSRRRRVVFVSPRVAPPPNSTRCRRAGASRALRASAAASGRGRRPRRRPFAPERRHGRCFELARALREFRRVGRVAAGHAHVSKRVERMDQLPAVAIQLAVGDRVHQHHRRREWELLLRGCRPHVVQCSLVELCHGDRRRPTRTLSAHDASIRTNSSWRRPPSASSRRSSAYGQVSQSTSASGTGGRALDVSPPPPPPRRRSYAAAYTDVQVCKVGIRQRLAQLRVRDAGTTTAATARSSTRKGRPCLWVGEEMYFLGDYYLLSLPHTPIMCGYV